MTPTRHNDSDGPIFQRHTNDSNRSQRGRRSGWFRDWLVSFDFFFLRGEHLHRRSRRPRDAACPPITHPLVSDTPTCPSRYLSTHEHLGICDCCTVMFWARLHAFARMRVAREARWRCVLDKPTARRIWGDNRSRCARARGRRQGSRARGARGLYRVTRLASFDQPLALMFAVAQDPLVLGATAACVATIGVLND